MSRSPLDFQDFEKIFLFLLSFSEIFIVKISSSSRFSRFYITISVSPLDFQDFLGTISLSPLDFQDFVEQLISPLNTQDIVPFF